MNEKLVPVHIEVRDAFGYPHVDTTIHLTDSEYGFLDGKEQRVPFSFPGQPNAKLQWYLVLHGEE